MIAEQISTALILESDADWDMRIHETLPGVAKGVQRMADYPFDNHPRDFSPDLKPYGDNWDILWIGHCGTRGLGNGRVYQFNDSSVPPYGSEFFLNIRPTHFQRPEGTRIVFESDFTVCAYGYAMTLRGATKMAKYLRESKTTIDLQMTYLCSVHAELTCLTVWPQVVPAAPSRSNIAHPPIDTVPEMNVQTPMKMNTPGLGLQYSARRNSVAGQMGLGRDEWIAEW